MVEAVVTWLHDELAIDLAQHLRSDKRMVWADMQLGPSGSARPDVYTIEKSYSNPLPTAYEIKISRSDLRSDTTSGKWQKYLDFAGSVIFAVPEGLCTAADIPNGCGLIVRKANSWRHVRKATRQTVSLPMSACMKLLIDGGGRTVEPRIIQPRRIELWAKNAAVRKKFGEAVAKAARDLASVQNQAADLKAQKQAGWERVDREISAHREYQMAQVKKDMAEFEGVKRELIEWLGLEGHPNAFSVRRSIAELRAQCSADERVQKVEAALANSLRTLRHALQILEPIAAEKAA